MKKKIFTILTIVCTMFVFIGWQSVDARTSLGAECKYSSRKIIIFGCVGETVGLCKGSSDCPPPSLPEDTI